MEMIFTVTVQVDNCDLEGELPIEASDSVREGILEALTNANNRGFNHPLSDQICMNVIDVEYTSQFDFQADTINDD